MLHLCNSPAANIAQLSEPQLLPEPNNLSAEGPEVRDYVGIIHETQEQRVI